MLNSVEAAVDTLEEAGAVKFTISQLPHFKMNGEAATTTELVDKFLSGWEKLAPGIYKVDYSKSATDTRGGLCFRVSKVGSPAGSPGAVAGIGNADVIMGFQQQIWNMQTDMRVSELQRAHEKQLADLKAKYENEGGGLGGLSLEGVVAGFGKIENIMRIAQGQAPVNIPALPAAVAGADEAANVAGTEQLTQSLDQLQAALGDALLVETMQKLAAKAQANPEGLKGALKYIDML